MTTAERETFLAERRSGIGGSDQAAIAGCNPWRNALDVYLSKVSAVDGETSDAAQRGIDLEPAVLAAYELRSGRMLEGVPMLRHRKHAEILCHLDARDSRDTSRIIEAKTASREWEDGVPLHYQIQAQHNMMVAEAAVCDVPVLFAPEEAFALLRFELRRTDAARVGRLLQEIDFRIFTVEADEEMQAALIANALEFWQRVQRRDPPPVTSFEDAKKLWPSSKAALTIEATADIANIEAQLRALEAEGADAEGAIERAKCVITAFMAEAEVLTVHGQPVRSWKSMQSTRFDQASFKAEYPDLAASFTKTTTTRTFRKAGKK